MRVLVTGGSGFIGTNLISRLEQVTDAILNLDLVQPKEHQHYGYWQSCDIRQLEDFRRKAAAFAPTVIVNLAAETKLLRSPTLEDYSTNIEGVSNVIEVCQIPSVVKLIHFSSMLVHSRNSLTENIQPKPDTDYGISKLKGEQLLEQTNFSDQVQLTILRPTSIWGPWFGEPYNNFFRMAGKKWMLLPKGQLAQKSFGFIDNAIEQTFEYIINNSQPSANNPIYLADTETIYIDDFLEKIREKLQLPPAIKLPRWIFFLAAHAGNLFSLIGINAPITTYRWHNLTHDRVVPLAQIAEININRITTIDDGISKTLDWQSLSNASKNNPHI